MEDKTKNNENKNNNINNVEDVFSESEYDQKLLDELTQQAINIPLNPPSTSNDKQNSQDRASQDSEVFNKRGSASFTQDNVDLGTATTPVPKSIQTLFKDSKLLYHNLPYRGPKFTINRSAGIVPKLYAECKTYLFDLSKKEDLQKIDEILNFVANKFATITERKYFSFPNGTIKLYLEVAYLFYSLPLEKMGVVNTN